MSDYLSVAVGRDEYVLVRRADISFVTSVELYEKVPVHEAQKVLPRLIYSQAIEAALRASVPESRDARDLYGERLIERAARLMMVQQLVLLHRKAPGPWQLPPVPIAPLGPVKSDEAPPEEIFAVRVRRTDARAVAGASLLMTSNRADRRIVILRDARQHEGAAPKVDLFGFCKQLEDGALGRSEPL